MPTLERNEIVFRFPEIEEKAQFAINFQRTLRIPDSETTYSLPPGLGSFPIEHAEDYLQVMVFTQATDTMDYLRELLAAAGSSVMCFSGRGGEVRNTDGTWTPISRDEVKRRFKEGRSEVLVCTDAAAEGLNFQFCGALVNYDMPWNPMRVEQRIGRIDRLGQRFSDVRIINLHYEDTVEADV